MTGPFKKILVTTDFSEPALLGLQEAERIAEATGAELVLLHVVTTEPPPGLDRKTEERIMDERRQTAGRSLQELVEDRNSGVKTKTLVAIGLAARETLLVAGDEGVDLIVMASHGRTALGRVLLGSTTEAVLHKTKLPVLVMPYRAA